MEAKLVRDKIPDLIRANGADPVVWRATDEEYCDLLLHKLREEVQEFLEAKSLEELADVLEVVQTLATALGFEPKDLERMRARKASERGGFNGKLVWSGNRPTAEKDGESLIRFSSAGLGRPQG